MTAMMVMMMITITMKTTKTRTKMLVVMKLQVSLDSRLSIHVFKITLIIYSYVCMHVRTLVVLINDLGLIICDTNNLWSIIITMFSFENTVTVYVYPNNYPPKKCTSV